MELPPSPWPTYSVIISIFLAFLLKLLIGKGRRKNLPPGPRPWPVIGNLNLIGPLPHRSIHDLSKKYGPLMQLRFGSYPVVVGSTTHMARLILKTHDLAFADRPKTAAGKHTTYNYSDILWSSYGPYWRQARKMCITELLSARRIDSYEGIRSSELRRFLHRLFNIAGEPLVLKDHLSTLSLNIISRMVLGRRYLDPMDDEVAEQTPPFSPEEFKRMMDELFLLNGVLNIGDSIPWLNFLDLQGYVRRMKAVARKMDCFMEFVLNEHITRRVKAGENFVPRDMVDVLIQFAENPSLDVKLSRDNLKAFTQDMIGAGTESTAVTIEWAMSELLKNPHIIATATEELDRIIGRDRWADEKDLVDLPYIKAIVKETMRLHPVTPILVPRVAREDVSIDGYDIPTGTRVLVNMFTISHDPTIWAEPEEFRPERFLGRDIDINGQDFELLPFGSGRRMCPAYTLAFMILRVTLANILHGFNWHLPKGMEVKELSLDEVCGLTTPKKVPLLAVPEPRLAAPLYQIFN